MIISNICLVVALLMYSCKSSKNDSSEETSSTATNSSLAAAPANLIDGSITYLISGWSPESEWDSVSGASSYEVAIGSTQGGTDVLDWVDVGNINVYRASGLSLLSSSTFYTSVRAVFSDSVKGAVATGDGWTVETCPDGYILVPGNALSGLGGNVYTQGTKSNYDWSAASESIRGTEDFCVMKYEAKDGGNHIAVSAPESLPWDFIPRELEGSDNDAQEACENNGAGFYLIGNQHWQAIARDIESVTENFDTSGGVADHTFNHGHADDDSDSPGGQSSTGALAATADDDNACFGIGDETAYSTAGVPVSISDDCGGAWHINKRTHRLSNGEVIWDFSGNVYEWLSDKNYVSQGSNGLIQATPYSDVLMWGAVQNYTSMTGGQKAGLGYGNLNYVGLGGVSRGGWWRSAEQTGIFSTNVNRLLDASEASMGFRCVYAP